MREFAYNPLMTDTTDQPQAVANENTDPFLRADTALEELYRLRRWVLASDPTNLTMEQWRQRRQALMKLDKAINTCLSCL
jgi:hypothetical protein